MATVYLKALNRKIEINGDSNLMSQLLAQDIPVASSCGGDGICGKCIVSAVPTNNSAPPGDLEIKKLKQMSAEPNQRLACQLYVQGDGTVNTEYW